MKVIRATSFKLSLSVQGREALLETIQAYTNAYNHSCQIGFDNNITNGVKLHHLVYQDLRTYLPAQFACSARAMATASLKSLHTAQTKYNKLVKAGKKQPKTFRCPTSKRMSILLDKNSYTLWFEKQTLSILTCSGRLRLPINWNKYSIKYKDWKYTSAILTFKKNKFFLNVCFEKDIEDIPANGTLVGIDRGIKKLAVTSNNQFFSGGEVRRVSQKREKLRASLQTKGSKSAKRHLRRLSGKEQRFKADVNHVVSKEIVDSLSPGDTIVLEDLGGIRNQRLRKKQRKSIHSWNYYQLEQFIKYKAEAKGINVIYVDARYTSQRCSKCGYTKKSNRKTQSNFQCRNCGFKLNADLNAARNIVLKHGEAQCASHRAEVNQPIAAPPLVGAASLGSYTLGS